MGEKANDANVAINMDEVKRMAQETIESVIANNVFVHSKVNQWVNTITEQQTLTVLHLTASIKIRVFIDRFNDLVTCLILQKIGAGLHTSSACIWDTSTDRNCIIRWENKNMHCIVEIFALSI
ncbi:dynein light chain Tctex-type 1-like protein [Dinothrombium tinctorium]|uniref:Dynein light chain Tctex-type 1-like protein n=1 Tax=Dinothrombium tinctorium TaxID=1965070 RepID=A0A443R003_9ACAR|nr:dynein light chain Tctex-type 1-like protein [Dinothrombium tinctorium]